MTTITEELLFIGFCDFAIGLFVLIALIDYKNKTIYQKIGISFLWGFYFIGILLISLFVGICDFVNLAISYVARLLEVDKYD